MQGLAQALGRRRRQSYFLRLGERENGGDPQRSIEMAMQVGLGESPQDLIGGGCHSSFKDSATPRSAQSSWVVLQPPTSGLPLALPGAWHLRRTRRVVPTPNRPCMPPAPPAHGLAPGT